MPRPDADRNLLFGILALQMDFIARDALVAAMNAWVLEKHRPIGEILVERGALDPVDRALLDPMVDRQITKHGGDAAASLAAMTSLDGIADLRRSVTDPDVLGSIAWASTRTQVDSNETPTRAQGDSNATRAPDTADFLPPVVRYRKVRDHAEGGLGIVYLARDEELHRDVALKEIKPKYADNPASRARFLVEAEITGGLEHPGIVPVYGLGHHHDGRPYYAMRFIRGDSLKHAIAAFHADATLGADPGTRSLALQKLLRRFLDVCDAVAYAHSRGVLHRDLKPDNVMVGRYGETLVVDWGLAKAVGRSGEGANGSIPESTLMQPSSGGSAETLPGSVVGTPGYMSPEQAAGRLDRLGPSSDVYSLGATLYTLLTGRVPVVGKELAEVLGKVERGEFPRPREASPWLDPALEAICLKAMALVPEGRYASPRGLAEDVERWLADEPVDAYPEPFARRAGRRARKHRTALATAATAATVAALLLGGVAWLRLAQRQRVDASALASLGEAEGLAIEAQATGEFARWEQAVASAVRADDRLESGGGSPALRRQVAARLGALRAGRDRLRADLEAEARDRRMVASLEEARLRGTNLNVDNPDARRTRGVKRKDPYFDIKAIPVAYLAAFRGHGIDVASLPIEDAARPIRSSRISDDLLAALDDWASYQWTGVPADRLEAIARAAETDPVRGAIRDAIGRRDVATLRRLCGEEEARRKLGPRLRFAFNALRRLDPAASLPLLEAIRREHPSDFWLNNHLGTAYFLARPAHLPEAARCLSVAVALRPESPGAHFNLGLILYEQGKNDQAAAEFRDAIRLKPDDPSGHLILAKVLRDEGDHDGSIAEFRAVIRLNPEIADAHNGLAVLLQVTEDLDGALVEFREAVRLDPNDPTAYINLEVASSDKMARDLVDAGREAVRLKPDDPTARVELGLALKAVGDLDGAIAAFREAVALKPDDASARGNLGSALHDIGDLEGAEAEFRVFLRLRPDEPMAHCELGNIRRDQGYLVEALGHIERGHALGSQRADWLFPSGDWVRDCRRLVELEANLPAILGRTRPENTAERLALANLCDGKDLPATSARYYADVFADWPAMANDPTNGHRYKAACAAARAGAGLGKDDPAPDEMARSRSREKALAWLRADLLTWRILIRAPLRQRIARTLDRWQKDDSLASIRDEAELARLTEAERNALRSFWADVEEFRKKAEAVGVRPAGGVR